MRGDGDNSGKPMPAKPGLRAGAVLVMAASCTITLGNIYLCQPLLNEIAASWHIPSHSAGLVATMSQVGYALGLLLIVPLADTVDAKKLMRRLLIVSALALLATAAAPSLPILLFTSLIFATASVVPQILIPIAAATVGPERRAKLIATMQTGLVLGILLSRTVSGAVADVSHSWRTPFILASILNAGLLLILLRFMPERPKTDVKLNYPALLASLPALILQSGALRLSAVLGACIFGGFSAFWATLAFHLASPGFDLGPAYAGMFGLLGAPGAILAPLVGRQAGKIGPFWINLISCVMALAGFLLAGWVAGLSLVVLVVAVNLMDFALQSGQVANQVRIFALGHGQAARLNTVYMVSMFAGGSLASWAATYAWSAGGWTAVCTLAACLSGLALVTLLVAGRGARSRPM